MDFPQEESGSFR